MVNRICEVPGLAPARKAARLTQDDLARELGVCKMTILRWENGQTEPSLGMLKQLAHRLNCTIGDLLHPSDLAS